VQNGNNHIIRHPYLPSTQLSTAQSAALNNIPIPKTNNINLTGWAIFLPMVIITSIIKLTMAIILNIKLGTTNADNSVPRFCRDAKKLASLPGR
jgi:hypothetical protein